MRKKPAACSISYTYDQKRGLTQDSRVMAGVTYICNFWAVLVLLYYHA